MAALTMTGLALLLAGAGAATQAVGAVKAGNAAKKAGQAQKGAAESGAELSDYNAAVADLQATDATQRGVEEESRFRSQVKATIGSQRATQAAQGVNVGYGSAVDVQGDAAFLGELDALTIRTNAAREAWGYKVQAQDLRTRATIQRKEGVAAEAAGNSAATTGKIAAVGTILGTTSSLLQTKYGFGKKA